LSHAAFIVGKDEDAVLSLNPQQPSHHFANISREFLAPPITYSHRPKTSESRRDTSLSMATPAQLSANRANAQRSTGPRSAEGKSVSRFNALKHGVDAASITLPGEDPAAYQAFADSYDRAYPLHTVMHRFLIDSLIRADWHKHRLQRLEADLIRKLLDETPGATLIDVMLSDSPAAKLLARVQRQIAAHERAWFRAHRELVRLANSLAAAQQDGIGRYLDYAVPEPRPAGATPYVEEPQESESPERTQSPAPRTAQSWPPVDEKTGKPLYFVG